MNFSDKVVVITGGSKGFGKELAQYFLTQDAKVVITSANKPELKDTAQELGCDYFVADASKAGDCSSLATYVNDKYSRIDVWVNNAGIQIAPSRQQDVDVVKLKQLFGINFFGYFFGCQVALRAMEHQKSGLIININSTAGLSGKPGLSAYVSSKFAIKGLTETLREELKGSGILVHQIFPGGMKTDIYHEEVPSDIDEYMDVSYAINKIAKNYKLTEPEQDLVIKRP
jgi:NAD(P)-dependent dehydrogenase (short-subunit alcohol dehydrogenase family)